MKKENKKEIDILSSPLLRKRLNKAKDNDFVFKAVLAYINQMRSMVKENKNLEDFFKTASSYKKLKKLILDELKISGVKLNSEDDFDYLLMKYLDVNFMKLCTDDSLIPIYKELKQLLDGYKNFPLINEKKHNINSYAISAVSLRSLKIIDELGNDKKAIDNFINLLKDSDDNFNYNLIYNVYYGLLCKDFNENDRIFYRENNEFIVNDVIKLMLRDNFTTLPDSMVKHLASDKQFRNSDSGVLNTIMYSIFKYDGDVGYEDYALLIRKIFDNNIYDLSSEAKFLDIDELYIKVHDYFYGEEDVFYNIESLLSDIKCDGLVFGKVDDEEDTYGNIR